MRVYIMLYCADCVLCGMDVICILTWLSYGAATTSFRFTGLCCWFSVVVLDVL